MKQGMMDKPSDIAPMTIAWLIPQYFITGLMEFFLTIGQLEFFYDQAPEHMQSMGITLFLTDIGAGHLWASSLVKLVVSVTGRGHQPWIVNNINQCRLHYFYWLLAGQMALAFMVYMVIAHRYEYNVVCPHAEIPGPAFDGGSEREEYFLSEKVMRPFTQTVPIGKPVTEA